ncbi:short-chain dehydrogenase/reductase [Microdochium trichocladiopsis]|uniref:Short-chain dehydrogenase/reductase n=1 Tax=Microdochium trichocladiopsis TaxID=1682393 RepID=A0A9P8YJ84_9PEZI|nr:short-chain dehydrogenase/reductase [Microdochium trichocladiopsis]KAH7040396.1 short-chain dehydrogenase/reductase [Microdochium trichocladiopsis]
MPSTTPTTSVLKPGNTAVITGGASGIGLALTKKCVAAGMKVLVVDYNPATLRKLSEDKELGGGGGAVSTVEADVSKVEDWKRIQGTVEKDFGGQINLLALNAGMQQKTSFDDADPAGFRAIMETNLFGVMNGITTLLPLVKAGAKKQQPGPSGETTTTTTTAAIVITGSKQGITNPPGNPAYNASKAAVKALAEHLSFDLARDAPSVAVHLLVPGWTWTGLTGAAGGGQKNEGAWLPEQVVDFLLSKMDEGQFWVLCPDNEVTEAMDRKRMLWSAGDAVNGRKPLSRWREEYKGEVAEWMAKEH